MVQWKVVDCAITVKRFKMAFLKQSAVRISITEQDNSVFEITFVGERKTLLPLTLLVS